MGRGAGEGGGIDEGEECSIRLLKEKKQKEKMKNIRERARGLCTDGENVRVSETVPRGRGRSVS